MNDSTAIVDGFFQCGKKGRRHGLQGGWTVAEVVKAVLDYRDGAFADEILYVAVYIIREDGMKCRYSSVFPPGQREASWELSG